MALARPPFRLKALETKAYLYAYINLIPFRYKARKVKALQSIHNKAKVNSAS